MHGTLARLIAVVTLVAVIACGTPTPVGVGGVVSVTIAGGDRSLALGGTFTLTATVETTGNASDAITWTSSDVAVATVDAAGTVTSLTAGVTTITATSTTDATMSDSIILTVVDPQDTLTWTRQFGTRLYDEPTGIATDANGNVYVSGWTTGVLEGSGFIGNDAFIRSYDRDGSVRWTRQFGTDGSDVAVGIASDADGNVYVSGYTSGVLEGEHLGGFDAFVRSYDSRGNLRWTRQFGTGSNDEASAIATDANGNVYVSGFTRGDLERRNLGGRDAFVRSYDSRGTLRWTRQFGTDAEDEATGIATDANGNVYVAGWTTGALAGSNLGSLDAFVRSYDRNGSLRWTRQFGTGTLDMATGIATDAGGNVYAIGDTRGALEGEHLGGVDAFVRSYDRNGSLRWTRQFGTGSAEHARGIAIDLNGNVYAAGQTGGDLEGSNLGSYDAFVRSYDRDGTLRWTRQFGTSEFDTATGVASDADGIVYVAGGTSGDLEGDNVGDLDVFIRKLGP